MHRGFNRNFENHQVPVSVGDELEVTIEAVGEKGDGVAKKDGFVLFVPNTKAKDYVRIRVTKVLRKVGFAEVVEKLEKPETVEEPVNEPTPPPRQEPEPEPSEDFGAELDEEED